MSVYARKRKTTQLQFVVTAEILHVEVIKYLMNDKLIGKKWRYILVQDAISIVNKLLDDVTAASTLFPNTTEKLNMRKKYLQAAEVHCNQLHNKLLAMTRILEHVVTEKGLSNIIKLLLDELNLVKTSYQNSKLIGTKV